MFRIVCIAALLFCPDSWFTVCCCIIDVCGQSMPLPLFRLGGPPSEPFQTALGPEPSLCPLLLCWTYIFFTSGWIKCFVLFHYYYFFFFFWLIEIFDSMSPGLFSPGLFLICFSLCSCLALFHLVMVTSLSSPWFDLFKFWLSADLDLVWSYFTQFSFRSYLVQLNSVTSSLVLASPFIKPCSSPCLVLVS